MDVTFQVPMQYCSLQHRTLLTSPVTSTTGYCFCIGSIPSFFLELFLHWSPVAYWAPTDLGSSSFSVLSFCLFILFMGFLRQEYWSGLPFPSPVDHIVSDFSTMTLPSWVAHTAWLSFIELDKAVVCVIRWPSFLWLWFQCVWLLMPSCNIYSLTWVSLTLEEGYLLMASPPDLRLAVACLGRHPWPQTWGSSSQPLGLTKWILPKRHLDRDSIPWHCSTFSFQGVFLCVYGKGRSPDFFRNERYVVWAGPSLLP